MFLGCSVMMAALAASAAITSPPHYPELDNHDVETPLKCAFGQALPSCTEHMHCHAMPVQQRLWLLISNAIAALVRARHRVAGGVGRWQRKSSDVGAFVG